MISNEELTVLFEDAFGKCKTIQEEVSKYKSLRGEHRDEIRKMYCNSLLYAISQGYTKYNQTTFEKDVLIQAYLETVKMLPKENTYYHLTYHFFKQDNKKCLSMLEDFMESLYEEVMDEIKSPDDFMNESVFIDIFFEPFKQAFDGFWSTLSTILSKYPAQDGMVELCEIIEKYYTCKTDDEALELLLDMMQKYSDLILIRELVGYTYYSMKMWNNAIAYFESVEETGIFFTKNDLYFMLAWSYGKIKNHTAEEEYYRKTIEIIPNNINFLNNLGYSLYLQKKYKEALGYFEKCLELDENYIYAANNYVRILIALGRNKDAKAFVKDGNYKVSKDIKKRVNKLDNTNARLKKEISKEIEKEIATSEEEESSQENAVDLGIKRQQFSNEKLLEDELTARIESGVEVFGLKLKMYKRKGVYGRQFIIPIGRLDLLCEDDKGDLYIIELKKDSGYDDAYKQTSEYLDWFEKNDISKGKKVYGIICLNSPSKELIDKVRKDKRMKLFEYQISYIEI